MIESRLEWFKFCTEMDFFMAKTYRKLEHWNHWFSHFMGKILLGMEENHLAGLLKDQYGKHTLLIGVPEQKPLLGASPTSLQYMLGPIFNREPSSLYIEGDLHELPIQSGSVDLVLLAHLHEYIDNPHKLVSEACRIVKPEGHIVICGFNPFSLWGLKKKLMRQQIVPFSGNFISKNKIIEWLNLADFELISQDMLLFRPPMKSHTFFQRLKFLEWLGKKCYKPFGGVYVLQARAKVIPLTPIKMHWKQELSGVQIATGIFSRPSSVRNFL